jgi:pyridinium-3,5-biscarboxylic acid mononucleotide synthase
MPRRDATDGAMLPTSVEPRVSRIESLLREVAAGRVDVEQGMRALEQLSFSDLGFARVDHQRLLRQGVIEFVFAPGKTQAQLLSIVDTQLANEDGSVVVTRLEPEDAEAIRVHVAGRGFECVWRERPRLLAIVRAMPEPRGRLLIVTAGTSDLPVAEEAELVAAVLGAEVGILADVGVAGLHRLLAELPELEAADAIVVVAGMDAALASVIGGIASVPVIACPTSVGYGASLGGLTALLSMISSCAPGVAVVNVDDGVGAGTIGALIARGRDR